MPTGCAKKSRLGVYPAGSEHEVPPMMPLTHEDNAHGLGGGFHMFHIASLGSIAIFIAKLNSVVDKAMEATSPKRRGGGCSRRRCALASMLSFCAGNTEHSSAQCSWKRGVTVPAVTIPAEHKHAAVTSVAYKVPCRGGGQQGEGGDCV